MLTRPPSDVVRYNDEAFEALLQSWKRGASAAEPTVLVFAGMPRLHLERAAQEVAGRLGRVLQRLSLADLAGKYIGETEKNLDRVLAAAQARGAVLLFDESDELFGQRTAGDGPADPGGDLRPALLPSGLKRHPLLAIQTCTSTAVVAWPRLGLRRVVVRFPPA